MKILLPLISLFLLTSCMTPSFTDSTLPQTGSGGRIDMKMLQSEPHPGLKEISYKRQFTRSTQDFEDSVRVMLFTDAYLKLNAESQGQDNSGVDADKVFATNSKVWVHDKTCFDFEINSNVIDAGQADHWALTLRTIKDDKSHAAQMNFRKKYFTAKNGNWYQFTGEICAKDKLDPVSGIEMTLVPDFRKDKTIELKWESPL